MSSDIITNANLLASLKEVAQSVGVLTQTVNHHFASVDVRFTAIDQRFDTIDQRFERIDQRFTAIDQRFDQIEKHFEFFDERFDGQEANFVNEIDKLRVEMRVEFNGFAQVQRQINKRLDNIDGRLIAVENDIKEVYLRIPALGF